jgi:hypothetical protein
MATRLIELEDGLLVEVDVLTEEPQPISGGFAQRVSSAFDRITPVIQRVCRSFVESYRQLPDSITLERAELELGLSFEAEGNLYITRSKGSANLVVRLTLRPAGADQ